MVIEMTVKTIPPPLMGDVLREEFMDPQHLSTDEYNRRKMMTKDFYEDALKLFTRKEDQDELKARHAVDHDLLVVDSTYIFLAKEADEVIDASDLMKRTLHVAAKNWNSAVEENKADGFTVMNYIRQTWHDEQYYNWFSVERMLSDMLLDHVYFDVAPELQTDYYRINTKTLKKELRNDHKKQRKSYTEYLKKLSVHDSDSMQEYLENTKAVAAWGYVKFGHDVHEL